MSGARAPSGGHGTCRSCKAHIVWFKTDAGKNMPIDASSVESTDITLDLARHVPHWSTCPDAQRFRKQRGARR